MSTGKTRTTRQTNKTHRVESSGTLLVTVVPPPVTLPVTTGSPVGTVPGSRPGGSLGPSGLLVGLGDNLGGQVQVLAQVVQTLGGEGVVVPLPRELGLDVSLGGKGLHGLDDLEVSDSGNLGVLREVEVLGGDQDTLLEEVLVDGTSVFLGNEHI